MPTQQIPNLWKKVKLEEILEIKKKTFNPKSNKKLKYIGLEHIEQQSLLLNGYGYSDETSSLKTYFYKGDILFGKMRPYFRKVIKAPFNGVCSTEIFVLHSKEGIDNDFIFYYLANLDFIDKVTKSCGGVDRPRAKWEVLKEFKFLLPSLPIQKKVASILSAYDDLIENNNKRIKILKQVGKAIFDDMMKQAKEKGELEEVKVKEIVDLQGGFAFKSKEYDPNGKYKVVTIKNVGDGEFITSPINRISYIPEKMKEHCKLKNGDILLSLTGNIGRVCMVYGENYLLNQRVAKLLPKNKYLYSFVYTLFRSDSMKNIMNSLANGVAQQNLSPIQLSEKTIKIPSQQTLQNFNNQVKPILDEILNLQLQNQNLKQTRDLLIPRLVSGKLDVEGIEI